MSTDATLTADPKTVPESELAPLEKSRRRPEFVAGHPVTLADGQTWYLPSVPAKVFPLFDETGKYGGIGARSSFNDPEFDALMAAWMEATSRYAEFGALFGLAIYLLGRNYDLSPEDFQRLLVYHRDVPELAAWPRTVGEVCYGLAVVNPPIEGNAAAMSSASA